MTRTSFKDTLQNLHFSKNTEADKEDKGYKGRPLITHFNGSFPSCVSNDIIQSVDEHMVKFKGRSGMKQYVKNKPIKYISNFATVVLLKQDIFTNLTCIESKKKRKRNSEDIPALTVCFGNTYSIIFLDSFFNSPLFIVKLVVRMSIQLGLLYNTGKARQE